MDKKISIILSTYNEAPYIEQAIIQILNNIKNVEIILVDDSSTDGTLEKAKKINNIYKCIQYRFLILDS